MPTNKTALYSVLTRNHDNPQDINLPGVKCFLFTDNPDIQAKGWEIIEIDRTEDCLLQRKIKILGHPILSEFDVTIYIDANMQPKPRFLSILRVYRGGFYVGKHIKRNCVYAEGLEVKKQGKAETDLVNAHIQKYYKNNFPVNFGMYSTGLMIRDKSCAELNRIWFEELEQHTHRDQLSLPYALKETGVKPNEINLHQFVNIKPHRTTEPPKIRSIQPWSSQKNIGLANNEAIAELPDDCWVVLTDGDSCWVLPDWGSKIEKVIQDYGDKYDLIGCVTGRLGGLHQCYNNEFDEDVNGYKEWEKANELWDKYGSIVEDTTGVAGVCLIFKKSTWKKVGGFKENSITCDSQFNASVRKSGGKIGLAKGLYRMHLYRIWEKEHKKAWDSVKHLK